MLLLTVVLILTLTILGGLYLTDSLVIAWTRGVSIGISSFTIPVTGGEAHDIDVAVAHSVTDQNLNLTITKAKLDLLILYAVTHDLIVYTNDVFGGTVQDSFTIKAGGPPLIWYANSGIPNPLAGDVTAIRVKNAGSTSGDDAHLYGTIIVTSP